MPDQRPLKLALLGAAPDTGNLGVTALSFSVIAAIARREPSALLTVFDHGLGLRTDELCVDGTRFQYYRCGLRNSRRYYMPESLLNVKVSAALRRTSNPAARTFLEADAILDITGGDSFTDLYGLKRFRGGAVEKQLALKHSKGLILLPQTYGPYTSPQARREATSIIRRSSFVIARDVESLERLRSLLGEHFDQHRQVLGVDVAFALPIEQPPPGMLDTRTIDLIESRSRPFGFNVSGLCLNEPDRAAKQFGFRADYPKCVLETLRGLLRESDRSILLIPHVVAAEGNPESDVAACATIASRLSEFKDRLVVTPAFSDPRHAKWLISQCEWFCGTRMHATIAGLSSGVPTASIAYSLKTRGVFASCSSEDAVADPRSSDTATVVDVILRAWRERTRYAAILRDVLPSVIGRANSQFDEVLKVVKSL